MSESLLRGSREILLVSAQADGAGKATSHNTVIDADEKSDTSVVPTKLPNNGDDPAEVMEGRDVAKGNADRSPA